MNVKLPPRRTISVQVDGVLSQPFSANGVPQGSTPVSTLSVLFINDLPAATSNPLHCFVNGTSFHCPLPYSSVRQANIDHSRTVLSASLVSDLEPISARDSINHIHFNPSKVSAFCFKQTSFLFLPVIRWINFSLSTWVTFRVDLSTNSSLCLSPYVLTFASRVVCKVGLLFRTRRFFYTRPPFIQSSYLPDIWIVQLFARRSFV